MTITNEERKKLAKAIHNNAVKKGFWEEKHSIEHYLMLAITELSEAVEADRTNKYADIAEYQKQATANGLIKTDAWTISKIYSFTENVKDTIQDELADSYIRLLDLAKGFKIRIQEPTIDIEVFTECSFAVNVFECIKTATRFKDVRKNINNTLKHIELLAESKNIDLYWHIKEKMLYNRTRERKHGKNY